MKSFLLVFLAVLFVSSVCAEDIVTPDGYLGRWSIDINGGINHNEATFYSPISAYSNFNDWTGGLTVMRPLSNFSTLYLSLSYSKIGYAKDLIDAKFMRQTSAMVGFRFYVK